MISLIQSFAGLTVAMAGLAIGLCLLIISRYWRVWKRSHNSARLLPSHILLIGTSYSMIALVAVSRLGHPPKFRELAFAEWWVYPFITLAFMLGNVGLVLILRFVARRGARLPENLGDIA